MPLDKGSALFSFRSSTMPSLSNISAIRRLCSVASATLRMSVFSAAFFPVIRGFMFAPMKDVIMGFSILHAMFSASAAINRAAMAISLPF